MKRSTQYFGREVKLHRISEPNHPYPWRFSVMGNNGLFLEYSGVPNQCATKRSALQKAYYKAKKLGKLAPDLGSAVEYILVIFGNTVSCNTLLLKIPSTSRHWRIAQELNGIIINQFELGHSDEAILMVKELSAIHSLGWDDPDISPDFIDLAPFDISCQKHTEPQTFSRIVRCSHKV